MVATSSTVTVFAKRYSSRPSGEKRSARLYGVGSGSIVHGTVRVTLCAARS